MASLKGMENPRYSTGACMGVTPSWYNTWVNMKGRCLRPTHPKYDRYGARGITICDDWMTSAGFKAWVEKSGWKEGLSIDRINNDGDYCPENCRWVSQSENSRKKRSTKISFEQAQDIRRRLDNGENAYDLASEFGVVHGTVWFIQNRITHVPEGECTKRLKERALNVTNS
jgi:hypothetical protein